MMDLPVLELTGIDEAETAPTVRAAATSFIVAALKKIKWTTGRRQFMTTAGERTKAVMNRASAGKTGAVAKDRSSTHKQSKT